MNQRQNSLQPPTSTPPSVLPPHVLQRACVCGRHSGNGGECAECRKKRLGLQRRAVGNGPDVGHGQTVAPPIVHEVLRSPGRPLDEATRGFMESRFNHDFSAVSARVASHASATGRSGVLQRQPAPGSAGQSGGQQPGVFAQNKVTTTTPVKKDSAKLIQSALTASRLLRPHLTRLGTGKDQVQITDKFTIHATLELFAGAWATFTGRPSVHISKELLNLGQKDQLCPRIIAAAAPPPVPSPTPTPTTTPPRSPAVNPEGERK